MISNNRGAFPVPRHVTTLSLHGGPRFQNLIYPQQRVDVQSGNQVHLSAIVLPVARLTYKWYRNNEEIPGVS